MESNLEPHSPLTRAIAQDLLEDSRPFIRQDYRWHPAPILLRSGDIGYAADLKPFMRLFDGNSGSQPDCNGRMLARESRMRLDNTAIRRAMLQSHADYSQWCVWTPFISFKTSPVEVAKLAESKRYGPPGEARPNLKVVVVDPARRVQLGLPVISFNQELDFYGVPDADHTQRRWHRDHYLCLWEVTPEEVVGICPWDELKQHGNWYDNIVLPALRQFRDARPR